MPTISVRTRYHARGWIMVPITAGRLWRANFILNTFTPHSTVSATSATILEGLGCLESRDGRDYVLRGLIIGGEQLADLGVRVGLAATVFHVEGMLGLNFLNQFASVRFDARDHTLTLELP